MTARAEVILSTSIGDSATEPDLASAAAPASFVPYLWRRNLRMTRPLLGAFCLVTYIVWPVANGSFAAFFAGIYTFHGMFLLLREGIESPGLRRATLYLDLFFLFLCLLHPGAQGSWLCAGALTFVLCLASISYSWFEVAIVVGAICGFFAIFRPPQADEMGTTVYVAGGLTVLFAVYKRSIIERLAEALRRSVLSRSEAEVTRESERQRIAADFHDGPLQSFISFQMRLELIRKLITRDPASAMRELVQLQDLGRSQLTELRSYVRNMQPADVTPANLSAAIREAVEHFERDSGIAAEVVCGDLSKVDDAMAGEILQITREALNNVRKHSKASRVSASITLDDDELQMMIDDDGSGFPFSGSYSLDELELLRLGPGSIKRRIRTIGGELTLSSRPTVGTNLRITVPVP